MSQCSCACACETQGENRPSENTFWRSRDGILLVVSGLCALSAEAVAWLTVENAVVVIALALISIACAGRSTLRNAWESLRTLSLGISFLMTLAVIGAIAIGHWPEAAMVLFLFDVAERIETATLAHAKTSIRGLMELAPNVARIQSTDGNWNEVPTTEVPVGAKVLLRPGERAPLDGKVVAGRSSVNQAPITGESLPVEKSVDDEVFAGTVNGNGALEILVTRASDNSTLTHIVRLVERAQSEKAPSQRWIEKFANVYTPCVVAGAVLVAAVPPLFFAQPFLEWFHRALVLLVIACPCALVISTPVTIWSGLAAAARRGILIKGGDILERGRELRMIAFDKTGTLTHGKPQVTDIISVNGLHENELLRLSASLEAQSEHPLGSAIVAHWNDQKAEGGEHAVQNNNGGGNQVLFQVENFRVVAGRGATGTLEGKQYFIGNHRFTHDNEACGDDVESHVELLESQGKTSLIFGKQNQSIGVFGLADSLRAESTFAVRELQSMNVATALLTGDNAQASDRIAAQAGITAVHSELLPQHKLDILTKLREEYFCVGMVGDGINDAPALAKADIGFVMGGAGTDTALEVADVALMDDDLRKIPLFIRLSKATTKVLLQNVVVAIAIKALFFALAVTGHATLWMAVFADVGASLLVVFNALRLLRFRDSSF